jgi:hypothetical protein
MEFRTGGEAPTFAAFADAWLSARDEPRSLLSADHAHLTDVQRGRAGADWTSVRAAKAGRVLAELDRISAGGAGDSLS